MTGKVNAITIEYGLHEGRFWMPRLQGLEGEAQAGFMHIPFKLEQSFKYASVNGSLPADSADSGDRYRPGFHVARIPPAAKARSVQGHVEQPVANFHTVRRNAVDVTQVPCDTTKLAHLA